MEPLRTKEQTFVESVAGGGASEGGIWGRRVGLTHRYGDVWAARTMYMGVRGAKVMSMWPVVERMQQRWVEMSISGF